MPQPYLLAVFGVLAFARSLGFSYPQLHIQDQYSQHDQHEKDVLERHDARPKPMFPHPPDKWPSGFVALGDSYSAGIGTGVNGTEDPCRLGLHAHPLLIYQDLQKAVKSSEEATFQFLSCTGSTVQDMLLGGDESQIGEFNTSATADFALLSIGGNDLGFFEIMNSCIFRFYSFYSGTCEEAQRKFKAALESANFEQSLRLAIIEVLDRVGWEKRPLFTITVTGYAQFFNADTTLCDDCSFGVWWHGPKLKRRLRRRMNKMVLAVNDKIRRSVDSINAEFWETKVLFVDYDALFEGHRFCEEGVQEPDYLRQDTWFFLIGGSDNADDSGQEGDLLYEAPRRPGSQSGPVPLLLPPGFPWMDTSMCMEASTKSGDWGERAICYMSMAFERDPSLRLAPGYEASKHMWHVPTYYGQTFHPVSTHTHPITP